jgi:hypothetical protein
MSTSDDSGPAFPDPTPDEWRGAKGMTLRQYAAIKLRVPNSGTEWLDGMIRTSLRNDFAAKAMTTMFYPAIMESIRTDVDLNCDKVAEFAYTMSDAMLQAGEA